jgi:hypothetical protein
MTLLTHLAALAAALDDLQIGATGRGLAAKLQGTPGMLVRTQSQIRAEIHQRRDTYILRSRLDISNINDLCPELSPNLGVRRQRLELAI